MVNFDWYTRLTDSDCPSSFFSLKIVKIGGMSCSGRPVPESSDDMLLLRPRCAWNILIHEKLGSDLDKEVRSQNTCCVYGQELSKCINHNAPLTCDFPRNGFICQFNETCRLKSAWRCPEKN